MSGNKSRRMRYSGHVARIGLMRNAFKIPVARCKEKGLFGRFERRRKKIIQRKPKRQSSVLTV